ncbi:alpha/beta hydrolase [Mucilaginibacter gossypii]|uniref:Acetyl esterase/lipase n=1 Tax=Mucilaginibacter gossypii TaxID=551996 RepID=A0A1G8AKV6_9SPHI|nr:alpha/beta hydrolase [Mucilaginibacter gossypii]SDH21499.1 Acetyl esterase/lipase [Mucilaginibacter gossypii]
MKKSAALLLFGLGLTTGLKAQDIMPKDSIETRYLTAQKKLGTRFSDRFYPNYVRLHQLDEKAFAAKIDSAAKSFNALLDTYQSLLQPAYAAAQRFEIKLYFDKILIEYPNNHEIYTNQRPGSYSMIDKKVQGDLAVFNDPALLGNSDLEPFIQSFLGYKINSELNKSRYQGLYNKRLYAMWSLLPKYFKNRQCLAFHQYHLLLDHITHNGFKHTEKLYELFKEQCGDTSFRSKLEQVYRDARHDQEDHLVREYKRIGNYGLDIHVFDNRGGTTTNQKPVIVFFHGGSWSEGQPSWHFEACRRYAAKGWVACSVEYRIYGSQGTLPFAAVMDARSAIRWLREHGNELGIDTGRIVATGNSAGGHLVLATALASGWNEKTDHLNFSPVPNVLLVNSGVYDLTDDKTAWIRKDLKNKDLVKGISPNELIRKNLPPTLLIHSMADQNVPYPSALKFVDLMKAAGNAPELKTLEQGGHFIFDHPAYTPSVFAWRKEFLKRLGYPGTDGE